jgi:hypothetical protein
MATTTDYEAKQIEKANATGRTPVVFIHGLWLRQEDARAGRRPHQQKRNEDVTEIVKMPSRGHSLTIDSGWREVCDTALNFVKRFT